MNLESDMRISAETIISDIEWCLIENADLIDGFVVDGDKMTVEVVLLFGRL